MAMNISSLARASKESLAKQLVSARRSLSKIKEKGAVVGENMMTTGVTIGSAALAGLAAGKFPGQWLSVDKEIWIGVPVLLFGLTGLAGPKASSAMMASGNGILSGWAYQAAKARA